MNPNPNTPINLLAFFAMHVLQQGGVLELNGLEEFDGHSFNLIAETFEQGTRVVIRAEKSESRDLEIPKLYMMPYGMPYFWQAEQTGILAKAVEAFMYKVVTGEGDFTPDQLNIMIDYVRYVINAPAFNQIALEIHELREKAQGIKTLDELKEILRQALELGIDPL